MTDNHGSDGPDKPPLPNSGRSAGGSLVSVVIPTYRRPHLLKAALRSVRAQTHRPLQVIVVDDDDDPATAGIVAEILANAEDLETVFLRQPNRGAAAARNRGLAAAQGAYVQFLDDDDELFPEKISAQAAVLDENSVEIVYGDWLQGQDIASARSLSVGGNEDHFVFLTAKGWIPPFAYLSRTGACRSVGGWDETLRFNDDFDFFLRLAASGATFLHRPLRAGFYRWHPGPRVSVEDRAIRVETNIRIIETAEKLRREAGPASPAMISALLTFWRRIAGAAVAAGGDFALCQANIERLRAELGRSPGFLERVLGPNLYYRIRAAGDPVRWARWLVHRVLPLKARRSARRMENLMRSAFGRAL